MGSDETAKELCKIRLIWNNIKDVEDYIPAVQLADGIARIMFSDIKDQIEEPLYRNLTHKYSTYKNRLVWAILKKKGNTKGKNVNQPGEKPKDYYRHAEKKRLMVHYFSLVRRYPRTWQDN